MEINEFMSPPTSRLRRTAFAFASKICFTIDVHLNGPARRSSE